MSSRQFAGWAAFYEIEPWGFWDAWNRNSRLCAVTANPYRKKGSRALTVADFMPKAPAAPGRKQSAAEMRAIMMAHVAASGGKAGAGKVNKPAVHRADRPGRPSREEIRAAREKLEKAMRKKGQK